MSFIGTLFQFLSITEQFSFTRALIFFINISATHEDEKESNASSKSTDKDTEFFERIKDETRDELIKDQIIDKIKNQKQMSNELMTRVQFADALDRKNKEIASLRLEINSLKEDLLKVKSRNRKLCNILGQGESECDNILYSFAYLAVWF